QRSGNSSKLLLQLRRLRIVRGDVDHHVAHLGVGAQELAVDVDPGLREDLVDPRQYARNVAVDVQQAQAALVSGQGDLREVDRRQGRAVVAVAHQLGGDLQPDV